MVITKSNHEWHSAMNTLPSWESILCSEQTPINSDISMMAIARIKMPQWWCHLLHVAVKVDSVPFMPSFKLFMLLMKAFRNSTTQPRDSRCVPRIKVSDSIEMEKNLDIYTGDDMLVLLLVRSNMLHLRMYTRHWKGADFWCLRTYLKINLKILRTILV